ncbi:hypothetical protein LSCM1_01125 [Leishmania martiniquensis]|uniref:Uncharacterized protein n=1 Tax=Leishmania martiniquensis TaxID=1580590 RepID=A0A836FQ08_9TRYP|nr:hypothetical protein LSCM1_01125 [Leishmania martiniquensis]
MSMSRDTARLDTSEGAAAHRLASLLQRRHTREDADAGPLRGMTAQIERFLATAPQVPAMRMEPEWMQPGSSGAEEVSSADEGLTVQLNVVAGVLEELDDASEGCAMSRLDGLVLPTAANQQELQRRKAEQAQAMLNLLSALSPSAPAFGECSGHGRSVPLSQSSDDDDGVAVMDMDDLMEEDSSEDEAPARLRRIVEMD